MQAFSSYHSDKLFVFNVTVTLTYDLMTSKSIGVIYCSPPTSKFEDHRSRHCRVINQTSFGLPTDGPTYRLTCAKQYTPSSSKGGIIITTYNYYNLSKILQSNVELYRDDGRWICDIKLYKYYSKLYSSFPEVKSQLLQLYTASFLHLLHYDLLCV